MSQVGSDGEEFTHHRRNDPVRLVRRALAHTWPIGVTVGPAAGLLAAREPISAGTYLVVVTVAWLIGQLWLQSRRDRALAETKGVTARDLIALEAVRSGALDSHDLAAYLLSSGETGERRSDASS